MAKDRACHSVWVSRWHKSQSHDPIWYLFQIGKPHVVYNISDTTPLIWRIIHGMAVTKKKLAESRDRMRGHQNICQCFEVSASFDHLSMSPRLVTRLCISASGGSCLPARSVLSWKCWPLSLQPNSAISERKSCSLHTPGTRSGCKHRDAPSGDYFNGILNTELPALSLNEPSICRRHTSVKMARLTNFDRKGVQCFLLINHWR